MNKITPLSNTQQLNEMFFNDNDPKYMCLCGRFHITKGAEIFLVLQAVGTLLGVIDAIARSDDRAFFAILWIPTVVIVFTAVALKRERRILMWPIIIYTGFCFFLSIICAILAFIIAISWRRSSVAQWMPIRLYDDKEVQKQIEKIISADQRSVFTFVWICIAIGCGCIAAVSLWNLILSIKCMRYFSDKDRAKMSTTLMYSNANATGSQRVIQPQALTPPIQQAQRSAQQLMQQEQFRQSIVRQQIQQTPQPFQQSPAYTFPSQMHTPVQQFDEPYQQYPEQSAAHHLERQLSNPQDINQQLIDKLQQQHQAYFDQRKQLLLQEQQKQLQQRQSQQHLVETHLLYHPQQPDSPVYSEQNKF